MAVIILSFGERNHAAEKIVTSEYPFSQLFLERIILNAEPFPDVAAIRTSCIFSADRNFPVGVQLFVGEAGAGVRPCVRFGSRCFAQSALRFGAICRILGGVYWLAGLDSKHYRSL